MKTKTLIARLALALALTVPSTGHSAALFGYDGPHGDIEGMTYFVFCYATLLFPLCLLGEDGEVAAMDMGTESLMDLGYTAEEAQIIHQDYKILSLALKGQPQLNLEAATARETLMEVHPEIHDLTLDVISNQL